MSLLKTQFVCDNETNVEEKKYRNDHDKSCIRRPNASSTVKNSDIESDVRDFHLRGILLQKQNIYLDTRVVEVYIENERKLIRLVMRLSFTLYTMFIEMSLIIIY